MPISMRVIALLLCSLGTAYANDEPHSLRDAKLGMTISEARAMKWPEKVYQTAGEPLFRCEGDEGFPSHGSSDGVTRCTWRTPPDRKMGRLTWSTPMVQVGEGMAQTVNYLFLSKEGETQPRLFQIDIWMGNNSYPLLLKGLKEKWGEPSKVDQSVAQNAFGATFSDDYTVWSNKVSRIALTQRAGGRVGEMRLVYQLAELQSLYEKRRGESAVDPGL